MHICLYTVISPVFGVAWFPVGLWNHAPRYFARLIHAYIVFSALAGFLWSIWWHLALLGLQWAQVFHYGLLFSLLQVKACIISLLRPRSFALRASRLQLTPYTFCHDHDDSITGNSKLAASVPWVLPVSQSSIGNFKPLKSCPQYCSSSITIYLARRFLYGITFMITFKVRSLSRLASNFLERRFLDAPVCSVLSMATMDAEIWSRSKYW